LVHEYRCRGVGQIYSINVADFLPPGTEPPGAAAAAAAAAPAAAAAAKGKAPAAPAGKVRTCAGTDRRTPPFQSTPQNPPLHTP